MRGMQVPSLPVAGRTVGLVFLQSQPFHSADSREGNSFPKKSLLSRRVAGASRLFLFLFTLLVPLAAMREIGCPHLSFQNPSVRGD